MSELRGGDVSKHFFLAINTGGSLLFRNVWLKIWCFMV